MPSATAVREELPSVELRERRRSDAAPVSEQRRYEPRFRVVTRKPLVKHALPSRSVQRSMVAPVAAASCLMVYVLFWTLNMRGAYYRDQLGRQIREARIEQAELEADKRRLQAPGSIFQRAASMGMGRPEHTEFAQLPAAASAPVKGADSR